ncbi:MAG: metal-dependent transcriptional regulator [Clostridia bacterium]|nr:metal-dependent transcriptional regulator [Clostridia bacterium]
MPAHRFDDYLTAIYILEDEGETVIAARLAEFLGVSAPTVSQMLRRLQRDGYVRVDANRVIRLTSKGERLAASMVRKHRLLERWLTEFLHLDWATADEEAHRLQSALSEIVEERLDEQLGHPTTCPHGNPIPGNGPRVRPLFHPLTEVRPGATVVVDRISELAEEVSPLLNYLGERGIVPGARFVVKEFNPHAGGMVLERDGQVVTLAPDTAAMVHVREVS